MRRHTKSNHALTHNRIRGHRLTLLRQGPIRRKDGRALNRKSCAANCAELSKPHCAEKQDLGADYFGFVRRLPRHREQNCNDLLSHQGKRSLADEKESASSDFGTQNRNNLHPSRPFFSREQSTRIPQIARIHAANEIRCANRSVRTRGRPPRPALQRTRARSSGRARSWSVGRRRRTSEGLARQADEGLEPLAEAPSKAAREAPAEAARRRGSR